MSYGRLSFGILLFILCLYTPKENVTLLLNSSSLPPLRSFPISLFMSSSHCSRVRGSRLSGVSIDFTIRYPAPLYISLISNLKKVVSDNSDGLFGGLQRVPASFEKALTYRSNVVNILHHPSDLLKQRF